MSRGQTARPPAWAGWLWAAGVLLLAGAVAEPGVPDPVMNLRAAREAHQAGEPERALRMLARLDRGPLADHASLLRARWLLAADEPEAALFAAEQVSKDAPSELRASALHQISRIHLAEDDVTAAYLAAERAWNSTRQRDTAARLAYEFAAEFETRGLPGDALRLYRRVWQRWARAEVSPAAFERSRFLVRATGAPPADPRSLIGYADSLRSANECDAGLPVYDDLLALDDLDPKARRRAEKGRALCLFQRRRYPEAKQAFAALAKSDPKDVDSAIRAARSDARSGHKDEAVRALSLVARKTRKSERARARYLVALVLSDDDPVSARRLFERVQKQRDAPSLSRAARWRLAWEEIQQGRHEPAIRRLRPLRRGSIWDVEVQRARYWTAVAYLQGDPERGRAQLAELADEIPLSYYGLLSADRLGRSPQVEQSFLNDRSDAGPFVPEQRARWLLEAGFVDEARLELESWFLLGRLSRAERVAAAELLHELGNHFRAVRLLIDGFGGAFEQGIDPAWRAAWQHAWPRPFNAAVHAAVREFEFDHSLVYAVMREESTYRPEVESPAGALGLMQIIPPTANRIADTLGENPFAAERLFDPATNIRFGTYYLKYLTGVFGGSRPLAIAAYNAGPDAVREWLERDGRLADDAFVDSVPYSETRRYLRKVIRSWRVYQLLYPGARQAEGVRAQPPGAPGR